MLVYILLGLLVYWLLNKFIFSKFKIPKIGAITLFTGGVKTGKSAVSLYFAIKEYKRRLRRYKRTCFINKLLNRFLPKNWHRVNPEKPLLYSSIPLAGIEYCVLTRQHLLRQVRFNYASVVFIDEASLVADSTLIQDKKVNLELLLFFKLFGHETKGGACIVNSHNITDLHFALKRCTSDYFYIHSNSRFIIWNTVRARELRYSEDGSDVNVFDGDVDENMLTIIMWSNIFKKYDCYCYSNLTDDLPVLNECKYLTRYESLKPTALPSFRPEFNLLYKGFIENEKENDT